VAVMIDVPGESAFTRVPLTVATAVLLDTSEGMPVRVLPSVSVTSTVATIPKMSCRDQKNKQIYK
jgi:hypothetical protein